MSVLSRSFLLLWQQVRNNLVAIISLVVAITSFNYNTARNEQTELNRNVRVAGFNLVEKMAALDEAVIYMHFDKDNSNDRQIELRRKQGWVTVLVIRDLCYAMPDAVKNDADHLFEVWQAEADTLATRHSYQNVNTAIDNLRAEVLLTLKALK